MIYNIAVCDDDMKRRSQLIEMLHVLSNEFSRSFQIRRYDTAEDLVRDLDEVFYHMVFINIVQAGSPAELDNAQDIHIKNPGTLLFSLCPSEEYKYYRDVAKEYANFKGILQYQEVKSSLMKAIKDIDVTRFGEEAEDKYAKVQLKRKIDYVQIDRITYIELDKQYIGIHTIDRSYYCYDKCEELFSKLRLRPDQFIKVSDHYYINFYQLYGMEKIEGEKRFLRKPRNQYYAVMVGYKQIPIEEDNYDIIFKRFVDEIIKNNQNRKLVVTN